MGPSDTQICYNVYVDGQLVATFEYAYFVKVFIEAYLESRLLNYESEEIVIQKTVADIGNSADVNKKYDADLIERVVLPE